MFRKFTILEDEDDVDFGVLTLTTEDSNVVAESSSSVEASSSSSVSGSLLGGVSVPRVRGGEIDDVALRVLLVRGGEIDDVSLRVLLVRGGEIDDVDLVELREGDLEGCLSFDFGDIVDGCLNLLLRVCGLRSPEGFLADDVLEVPKIRRT